MTYNTKQNLLVAISVRDKTAYHLLSIDVDYSDTNKVKLIRRSRWHSQYSDEWSKLKLQLNYLLTS